MTRKKPVKTDLTHWCQLIWFTVNILLLIFGISAQAKQYTVNLSSTSGSGTLVLNKSSATLHVPLQVYQYDDGGFQDRTLDVGDGSDGAFNSSTYASFSQGGSTTGNVIAMSTSRTYQFTSFTLNSGWTIRPVGSSPLIIKVQSGMTIAGIINCSGEDGEDGNSDATVATSGGAGRCGGGAGGAGGYTSGAAGTGSSGGVTIGAGPTGGGGATASGKGGGGGGAYAVARGAPYDPASGSGGAGSGAAGTFAADHDFDTTGGGWGGGGGGKYDADVGSPPNNNSAGGAGGGGGGTIMITAMGDVNISGTVKANGGVGGDGAGLAGAGGGGGGGSIAIFASGDVKLSGSPIVQALGGNGGTGGANNGGLGASGRTWLVGTSGYSVLVAPNTTSEDPSPLLTDVGLVRYQTGSFSYTSDAFDLGNTRPHIIGAAVTSSLSGGATATLTVAQGASASFTAGSFESPSSVTASPARYFRFKMDISNSSLTGGAQVSGISVTYDPFRVTDFDFQGQCGLVDWMVVGSDPQNGTRQSAVVPNSSFARPGRVPPLAVVIVLLILSLPLLTLFCLVRR